MIKNIEKVAGKVILVHEGNFIQEKLGEIFANQFMLNSAFSCEIPHDLTSGIDNGLVNFLLTHPIVREHEIVIAAHKKIPTVVTRGRSEFEGDGDIEMFETFIKLGIPVINKELYFRHGYLMNKFAIDIVNELTKQIK